jgi:hypothetical protein
MAPEDNSEVEETSTPSNNEVTQQPSDAQNFAGPAPTPIENPITTPLESSSIRDAESSKPIGVPALAATPTIIPSNPVDNKSTEGGTSPDKPSKVKKKLNIRLIAIVLLIVILFAGATTTAFYIGKHKRIVVTVVPSQPINLPPSAIVAAACVPGRGKQYIIPKDIPQGPIYDVENGKVIAIEYLIDLQQLEISSNSDAFSSTLLTLVKNYQVDHLEILPVAQQTETTDDLVHIIMFVVSKSVANSITCPGPPVSTASPSPTAATLP